jgi:hypothetical protein
MFKKPFKFVPFFLSGAKVKNLSSRNTMGLD